MNIWDEIKHNFKTGSNLTRVLFINVGVFLMLHIFMFFGEYGDGGVYHHVISNLFTYLNPNDLISKPWTMITYIFVHEEFFHLFSNMILLFWMGRIFVDMLNSKRFLAIYILGGIVGGLTSLLFMNLVPEYAHQISMGNPMPMLGASAAVMAITAAVGTYLPEYQIFLLFIGRVKLKYLALVLVVLDIIALPNTGNLGGHIAHLGGAAFGFIWASQLKKNNDISKWFMNVMDKIATMFKPRPKMKVSYSSTSQNKSRKNKKKDASYVDFQEVKKSRSDQKEIDAILDKIAKSGYESLTKSEKEKLFSASNKRK